jgi:hypothetical protein
MIIKIKFSLSKMKIIKALNKKKLRQIKRNKIKELTYNQLQLFKVI